MNDNIEKNLDMENLNDQELEQVNGGGLKQEKRYRHVWEIYCTKCNASHSIWRRKPEVGEMPLYCRRCMGYKHFKVREYDKESR